MAIHQREPEKRGADSTMQIRTATNNEGLGAGRSVAQARKILPREIHGMDGEAESLM